MTFRNFVASPLLHFFLLGGLIFAVYYALNPSPDTGPADEITVSEAQAEVLADKFRAVWGRPPTEAELTQLMANWVTEEAFVREAEALGLDRGDAVIRQRLNQKMQFLIETGAAALTPDDAELQAYLDENADRFTKAPHFAFEQIMLPKIGAAEAAHAVMKEGADPASVRTATILPHSVSLSPAWSIDRDFGEGFAEALAGLPDGSWQGPVESGYGPLLVRINKRQAAELPALDDIRDEVEQEWRRMKIANLRDQFSQTMLARYRVNLPSAKDVLSQ